MTASTPMFAHVRRPLGLVPLAALAACGMFQSDDGLASLEHVHARIERVHVDLELAKQAAQHALAQMQNLVSPAFAGDAKESFSGLEQALAEANTQGEQLRDSTATMRRTAEPMFERWRADLLSFANPQMRQRSMARLEHTQALYRGILAAVEPAQSELDALNLRMRDVTLFLSNDFNAAAIATVDPEVRALGQQSGELHRRLDASMQATLAYLDSTAMPYAEEQPAVAAPPR